MSQNRCSFVRVQSRPVSPRLTAAQVAANLSGVCDARTGDPLTVAEIDVAVAELAMARDLAAEAQSLLARWREDER